MGTPEEPDPTPEGTVARRAPPKGESAGPVSEKGDSVCGVGCAAEEAPNGARVPGALRALLGPLR